MSIDFSKAPEGATHYGLDKRGDVIWYSGCFGDVLVFADAGYWALSEAHSSFDRLTPIPTFKPFVSVEDALAAAGVLGRSQAEMLKIHRQIKRLEQTTTGSKHDAGKPLMGAVPPNALLAVAKVLTLGAEKYGRDNWRQVENAETRYMDAALRHLNAYQRGEAVDPESGESHLAHAVCGLMFAIEMHGGAK